MAAPVPQFLICVLNVASSIRVIIVNYNAAETISACIRSVLAADQATDVTLYDNASSDDSVQQIRDEFTGLENLEIIQDTENIGFTRAINAAATARNEKYLLLESGCGRQPGTSS